MAAKIIGYDGKCGKCGTKRQVRSTNPGEMQEWTRRGEVWKFGECECGNYVAMDAVWDLDAEKKDA